MIDNCNCGCEPASTICEPLNTNDINYVGNANVCTGIVRNSTLTEVLEHLITFSNNRIFSIVSDSLEVTFPQVACNRVAEIEIVPSEDAGNIFILGTDGYPFVPAASSATITKLDTNTVDLGGDGTIPSPLTADVIVSTQAGNQLSALASGLYVPTPATQAQQEINIIGGQCVSFTKSVVAGVVTFTQVVDYNCVANIVCGLCGAVPCPSPTNLVVSGNFLLSWNSTAVAASTNALNQIAYKRIAPASKNLGATSSFTSLGFTPTNPLSKSATSATTTGDKNTLYDFKIEATCTTGGPSINTNSIQQGLSFNCLATTFTTNDTGNTSTEMKVSVNTANTDIYQIVFTLKNSSTNAIVQTYTSTVVNPNPTVHVFTGLTPSTPYYVESVYKAIVNGVIVTNATICTTAIASTDATPVVPTTPTITAFSVDFAECSQDQTIGYLGFSITLSSPVTSNTGIIVDSVIRARSDGSTTSGPSIIATIPSGASNFILFACVDGPSFDNITYMFDRGCISAIENGIIIPPIYQC